ncbi:Peptidoglycan D,D-transpeptidase MrdA [bioreactor metagenome]|uniref:Peptidoglycan D,D-transpeptidase MrdA n=1 Tax=bioreactor metagenome TaxID=1076179 RepID=A0A644TTN6_9ZZZZ|nr:penicillin-binding protein 2 [Negativicutes bacterium]
MWDIEQSRRMGIMTGIAIGVILLLILRLAWLQIFQGAQYKKVAEENRIRQMITQAPRGTVYDRNGAVLVSSRPSFALSIVPAEYTNRDFVTPALAEITGLTVEQIDQLLAAGADMPLTPIRLRRDIEQTVIAKVEERRGELPGVIIEAIPVRYYVYESLAAHTLGYVGNISGEEYAARKESGYRPNDLIGKDGLEREWEEVLRGVEGGLQVEVNALGEEIKILGTKPAQAGQGLVLTLDANLQKETEKILNYYIENSRQAGQPVKGGSAVVLDVKTGSILAMASLPDFDPNLFVGGINAKDWNKLISDPNNPLINRTIKSIYPPASVFKIITAAAALDMGYTTADEVFFDQGIYVLNGWSFYGWNTKGLGKLSLAEALAWSSDPVFYELGHRLGADHLANYALAFGLGQKTGIGLLGEQTGVVPTQSWKLAHIGEEWYPGETLIAAIGQGYYLVTPLQQALVLMAVANGGIIYRPMLVDKIITTEGVLKSDFAPEVMRTVYLKPEHWDVIRQGLVAVTTNGTGATVFSGFPHKVAGKSGSAETGREATHSWFAAYAPADNPAVVVSVLVDEGGEGSAAAAPAVRRIFEAYFGIYNSQPVKIPSKGTTD